MHPADHASTARTGSHDSFGLLEGLGSSTELLRSAYMYMLPFPHTIWWQLLHFRLACLAKDVKLRYPHSALFQDPVAGNWCS